MATVKKVEVETTLGQGFTIQSDIRGHRLYVDQPAAAGGRDAGPTPLEYLFLSLAGCIATLARIVANQKRIPLRGVRVGVSGDIDVSILLGKGTGRSGFTGITVTVDLDTDLSPEEKAHFLEEVDRRCPVSDNLKALTPVSVVLA